MPLLIGAAGVGLLSAGAQYFGGRSQQKAGEKALSELNKPVAEIPQELLDQLSDAEKTQVMGLRPEQKAEFVRNLERSRQDALKASASRKGGLLGVQAAADADNSSFNSLIAMDASAYEQNKMNKQQQLNAARGNIASWKQNQYNQQREDYNMGVDSANAMIGAGKQNQFGAFGTLGNTALGIAAAGYSPKAGG